MTIDILPTVSNLIGAQLPNHKIDGKDITPLLKGIPGAASPQEAYFMYYGRELQAMRMGKWKLHFPHRYRTMAGRPGGTGGIPTDYSQDNIGLALFDLSNDIGETTDVKDDYPEVLKKMQDLADDMRTDLGDSLTKVDGEGLRSPGKL